MKTQEVMMIKINKPSLKNADRYSRENMNKELSLFPAQFGIQ
jgi:hypothetical protein